MALFTVANAVRRSDGKLTDEFSVRVGLHESYVLSPLLFAVVMDVIAKEIDCCLPWDVLYADDLVVMAESEQALMRRILKWKKSLSAKSLKVNAAKTKVMTSIEGSSDPISIGEFPCGVCRRGVGSNSVRCTRCLLWVHRVCSGIKGGLARASATFTCRRCKGEVKQPKKLGKDGVLVVDGAEFEVAERFYYLDDVLDAG